MKVLTICEHPVEVRVTDSQGNVETKWAIFLNVLEGVSATFMADIYLWLNSRPQQVMDRWKGLPVFVYFLGGDAFPKHYTMRIKGCERPIHLVNVNLDNSHEI
jgi:hypothetical protein